MNIKGRNNYRKTGNEQAKGQQRTRTAGRESREDSNADNFSNARNSQNRESVSRQKHSRDQRYGGFHNRSQNKVKAVETIDDIRADISRIEKEIELEIKEIRSLRLGL